MVFVLNDNEIAQKRTGYPDVKIAFSEIATLREELRWLIIKTAKPGRRLQFQTLSVDMTRFATNLQNTTRFLFV